MKKTFEIVVGVLIKCQNKDIVEVVIPDGVTHIGARAFSGCKKIQSVTIPNGVTDIGAWAFYGCRNLQSIHIPDSVTHIGYKAFPTVHLY